MNDESTGPRGLISEAGRSVAIALQGWGAFGRMVLLMFIAFILFWGVYSLVSPRADIQAQHIRIGSDYLIFLSASEPWRDTGIDVTGDGTVLEVHADGRIRSGELAGRNFVDEVNFFCELEMATSPEKKCRDYFTCQQKNGWDDKGECRPVRNECLVKAKIGTPVDSLISCKNAPVLVERLTRYPRWRFRSAEGVQDEGYMPPGSTSWTMGKFFPNFKDDKKMSCRNTPHDMLVGIIRPLNRQPLYGEADCIQIGTGREKKIVLAKENKGRLYLVVNDAEGFREDNAGFLQISISVRRPTRLQRIREALFE